jgi:hypothetical protein
MLLLDGEAMQLHRARYTLAREKADESHQQAQHGCLATQTLHTPQRVKPWKSHRPTTRSQLISRKHAATRFSQLCPSATPEARQYLGTKRRGSRTIEDAETASKSAFAFACDALNQHRQMPRPELQVESIDVKLSPLRDDKSAAHPRLGELRGNAVC